MTTPKIEYLARYPDASLISNECRKNYSRSNKINGPKAVEKMKAENRWEERKADQSQKIKAIIDSDPRQREIRRQNMTRANIEHKERLRKISSETAKKTSARPEILEARSMTLQKWRDENREDFYEKCTGKMLSTRHSKPELLLFQIVSDRFPNYEFKLNQSIRHDNFIMTKSKRKQIDIFSSKKCVIVEFDGIRHFEAKSGQEALLEIQKKDSLMNSLYSSEYAIFRISQSCFKGDRFRENVLNKLFELISNPVPGVYKLGEEYGQDNLL